MTEHVEHEHQVITTALDALEGEERAYMLKTVPAPMRMLLPLMVERPWKKYAATLRNGT
jgi:hypothetical protein